MSSTYCNEPWKTVHYDNIGLLGPCCTYRGNRDTSSKSVQDYLDSGWLKELKRKMLNSERDAGCEACWRREDAGGDSQRLQENRKSGILTESNIQRVWLSFGNICNKNCNICRPARSSIIAKEYKKLGSDHEIYSMDSDPEIVDKQYSGIYLDKWENYIEALDHAHTINLDGGEPFFTKQCTTILETLIKNGSTDKTLSFSTNGSATEQHYELLKHFKQVEFGISIDGIDDLYSLVRSPHNWDWWEKQHKLMEQQTNLTWVYLAVLHSLNVHQLPRMIKYFSENNPNTGIRFHFTTITTRPYLGTHVAPNDIIENTIVELKHMLMLDDYNFTNREIKNVNNIIDHLVYSMNNKSTTDEINFKKFVDMFGPIKNLDYQSYLPWSIK
jgi:molybdenum cofactor biosynthesis enzyme MoaA